eukprot:scaffold1311_cov256-Pinguiococcus_pyrenoidosus.AAC.26
MVRKKLPTLALERQAFLQFEAAVIGMVIPTDVEECCCCWVRKELGFCGGEAKKHAVVGRAVVLVLLCSCCCARGDRSSDLKWSQMKLKRS